MSEPSDENISYHSSASGESTSQPSPWFSLDQASQESQLPLTTGSEDSGLKAKGRSGIGRALLPATIKSQMLSWWATLFQGYLEEEALSGKVRDSAV